MDLILPNSILSKNENSIWGPSSYWKKAIEEKLDSRYIDRPTFLQSSFWAQIEFLFLDKIEFGKIKSISRFLDAKCLAIETT